MALPLDAACEKVDICAEPNKTAVISLGLRTGNTTLHAYHLKQFDQFRRRRTIEFYRPERVPVDFGDDLIRVELTPACIHR